MDVIYHTAIHFVTGAPFNTHCYNLYSSVSWLSPHLRRPIHWYQFIYKTIIGKTPHISTHYSASLTVIGTYADKTDAVSGAEWSSSDTSIATVAGGVVTFLKPGVVTITVTVTTNGASVSDSITVTVKPTAISGIEITNANPMTIFETTEQASGGAVATTVDLETIYKATSDDTTGTESQFTAAERNMSPQGFGLHFK